VTADDFINDCDRYAAAQEMELEEAMTACAEVVAQGIRDSFAAKESPTGERWPERRLTIDEEHHLQPPSHHPLLELSGLLRESAAAVQRVEKDSVEVGTTKDDAPYAFMQHFGGTARVFVWELGWLTITIPERQWVGVSDKNLDQCVDTIATHAAKQLWA
jgi:hypothetical protein